MALASWNTFGERVRQRSDGLPEVNSWRPSRLRLCHCGHIFLWDKHVSSDDGAPVKHLRWADVPDFEDALRRLDRNEDAEFETEVRLWCFWTRRHGDEPLQDGNTARLLELLPSGPDTILVRGQALRDLGRFDEALAVYGAIPETHPWRSELVELAKGRCLDVVWDLDDAAARRVHLIEGLEEEATRMEGVAQKESQWAAERQREAQELRSRAEDGADLNAHAEELERHARQARDWAQEIEELARERRADAAKLKSGEPGWWSRGASEP